jgi:hypothetical protein
VCSKVNIQSVDMFGPRIGFIKLKADITNKAGQFCPGICFLRGGAVAVLVILTQQEDGQEFTVSRVAGMHRGWVCVIFVFGRFWFAASRHRLTYCIPVCYRFSCHRS